MLTVEHGFYYLAGPYTAQQATTPALAMLEMQGNAHALDLHAGKLMDPDGLNLGIYSPISHCHEIAKKHKLPTSWEYWRAHDVNFIEKSLGVIVLMRKGWQSSQGVTEEIQIAKDLDLPVFYHHETTTNEVIECLTPSEK